MREIHTHQVKAAPSALRILVIDAPGAGGACHEYEIIGFTNDPLLIQFQNGPIPEKGTNGVTQEALLAIVQDRLECFQAGPYPSTENKLALLLTGSALDALKLRTERRARQGTEGKMMESQPELDSDNGMGVLALVNERFRQILEHKITAEHDDTHQMGELAMAAGEYLKYALQQIAGDKMSAAVPEGWPWGDADWKPSEDPRRNLEKAGALMAAEWDRLERRRKARVELQLAGAAAGELPPPTPPEICGAVGETRGREISAVCQLPKGHTGNHGGMGCEWNDAATKREAVPGESGEANALPSNEIEAIVPNGNGMPEGGAA